MTIVRIDEMIVRISEVWTHIPAFPDNSTFDPASGDSGRRPNCLLPGSQRICIDRSSIGTDARGS